MRKKILLFICILVLNAVLSPAQNITAGAQEKLLLPFLEARTSQNTKGITWGSVFYTSKLWKPFPCQLKIGNITAGGGFSKLKDPSLSQSITPFSKAKTDVSELTASLPGLSSTQGDTSIFGEFCYSNKKGVFSSSKINCFYNGDDIYPVFSGSQAINILNFAKLTLASTAGYFTYQENTCNSWFTTSDFYYHKGSHFCFNPQISVRIPHFETLFSFPGYQSPFGKIQTAYKSENKLTFRRSCISFSLFYNENELLLTTHENTIKNMVQTKTGFQSTVPIGINRPVFLRAGITATSSFMLSESDFDSHKLKLSTGARIFSMFYSFSFIINSNFSFDTTTKKLYADFDSGSVQFSNSWQLKKISPELNLTFSLNPSENYESISTSEKIGINLTFCKNPKISAANSLTLSQKDGESTNQSFYSAFTVSWRKKYLALLGKIGIKLEY